MFGPQMEGQLGSCSFVHRRIIGAVGGFFGSNGGIGGAVRGFTGGGGATPPGDAGLGFANVGDTNGQCAPGYFRDQRTGQCERPGVVGTLQRIIPGGQTGTQMDVQGEAVVGSFQLPGVLPAQVGTITRNDGVVNPILRCPSKYVLGIDNICYVKGTPGLSKFRKWPPGTRPFLTGGDVRCLRRANSLKHSKGNRKLLRELGMG